jgi:hypothetical protein
MMHTLEVVLRVLRPAGGTEDEVEAATEDLVDQVIEQPGVASAPVSLVGRPGTKGVDPLDIGVALLTVLAEAPALYDLIGRARDWMRGNRRYPVQVEIDDDVLKVDGASEEDIRNIIEVWLRRHGKR